MKQPPRKCTETGLQTSLMAKATECTAKEEKPAEATETPFERDVVEGIRAIIALLEESNRTKSIADIFKVTKRS